MITTNRSKFKIYSILTFSLFVLMGIIDYFDISSEVVIIIAAITLVIKLLYKKKAEKKVISQEINPNYDKWPQAKRPEGSETAEDTVELLLGRSLSQTVENDNIAALAPCKEQMQLIEKVLMELLTNFRLHTPFFLNMSGTYILDSSDFDFIGHFVSHPFRTTPEGVIHYRCLANVGALKYKMNSTESEGGISVMFEHSYNNADEQWWKYESPNRVFAISTTHGLLYDFKK